MGIEATEINARPSYFVTALNTNGQWKSNILYETKVRDLNFTPSDERMEFRFFTKEEAQKSKLHPIAHAFVREYNPDNHAPGGILHTQF